MSRVIAPCAVFSAIFKLVKTSKFNRPFAGEALIIKYLVTSAILINSKSWPQLGTSYCTGIFYEYVWNSEHIPCYS